MEVVKKLLDLAFPQWFLQTKYTHIFNDCSTVGISYKHFFDAETYNTNVFNTDTSQVQSSL